jgi:hypothetical protein
MKNHYSREIFFVFRVIGLALAGSPGLYLGP